VVGVGWSFCPGRKSAATGQPRGLWRSPRARLKALGVLLAGSDSCSADAVKVHPQPRGWPQTRGLTLASTNT
jgi:hypothetical protein